LLAVFRNILIALAVVSFLILLAAMPVRAQTWSSAASSGLTSVESRFENGTYIWTLVNNSSLAVVPGSGSDDGDPRWKPTASRYGETWHDKSDSADYSNPVPEPQGLLVLAAGILGLAFHILPYSHSPTLLIGVEWLDGAASPGI